MNLLPTDVSAWLPKILPIPLVLVCSLFSAPTSLAYPEYMSEETAGERKPGMDPARERSSKTDSVHEARWYYHSDQAMGTAITLQLLSKSKLRAEFLFKSAMDEFHRIDRLMSPYKNSSELKRINTLGQKTQLKIHSELMHVIDRSLYYSQISDGAFDITFASIGFRFDYREKIKPTQDVWTEAKRFVDYRNVVLDQEKQTIRLSGDGTVIDLGGIAKGYAVDRVAALLAKEGVSQGLVTAGGDTRVIGSKQGQPWLVGIANPRGNGHVITLPLTDVSISTSGDYERFFIEDKVRYHHIINPKTGSSANEVISATVLANDSLAADALSTTIFVLGVKKGKALIETLPDTSCIFIDSQGKVHYSTDLGEPVQ